MSHEIRTPINAVLGMNEMILREEREPEIRGYAENIRTAGNSLLTIVNDVLDISKIESGRIEISNGEYELSSLVSDCCSMTALRAQEKGLSMNVVCDGEIPLKLIGDEPHIRQVVVNLLTNAVKYTENGGVTLTVSGAVDGDLCRLRFSVLDTGSGISEADQGKLFDQFQRLDLMRNRNIEGTGLGLAIVRRLTELMGGTISVKSALGEGSEFLFEVPQRIAAGAPSGKLNVNYSTAEPAVYSHSFEAPEASVLVVDDLPVNLLVIVNLLKDTRIQTDTAGSGAECLEAASRKHYDLILMDHMMPEMDGIEAMCKIREISNVPVILLTAKSEDTDKVLGLTVGADDYVTKPFNPVELQARVKSQIRRYMLLGSGQKVRTKLSAGGIELDDKLKEVTLDGEPVNLTRTEYDILKLLMEHPGEVYSPKQIYEAVWKGSPCGVENTVAVHIRHLREKLEYNPAEPRYLKVVWGRGYKMEDVENE